eukprot:TRINITY_DN94228_c0_g1_i1.p2 TRINITY_DN94228_c0_g1~~TRINITY_DN94228_c0_g1_i1.p2  ORF type:complete len:150 (+),score=55.26 TRINITY_DN94228_c0_g1_i1:37-486(+)
MHQRSSRARIHSSLLPLQVFAYYNWYYELFYFVVSIIAFVYKGSKFPYPEGELGAEIAGLCAVFLINLGRLVLVSSANKQHRTDMMVVFFIVSIFPAVAIGAYFLSNQIYVLRVDFILNVIQLVFIAVEGALSILAMLTFSRIKSNMME